MIEAFLNSKISEFARQYPHKTAIKSEDQRISYLELEKKSNQVANFMHGRIKEIPHVIIILERSPGLIASIIGLLKCGLVFVPLNPVFPKARVKKMIEEIHAEWVITNVNLYKKFKDVIQAEGKIESNTNRGHLRTLLIDDENGEVDANENIFYWDSNIESDSLTFERVLNKNCYIYFTSGSTGVPKGVLGRLKSLAHFIQWEMNEFRVDETFNISQLTPPSFDPFLRDLFLPLMAGGTSCIPSNNTLMNMRQLIRWINENEITLIHTVPSLFKSFISEIEDSNCFHTLKYILLAGELLRGKDIYKFIEIFNDRIQLVNVYGPTETTLAKLFYRIKPGDVKRTIIPVGKTINGARVLILDSKKRKCSRGQKGEIYIRTPFISSGYYNDPYLTGKVFIKNPYGKHPGDIIYKTGDLGRMLPDGNLELSGRLDFQVKIRGIRIESGEIENRILQFRDVQEAVVTANEDGNGDKYLCAYVVLTPGKKLNVSVLREFLSKDLPRYMVPSFFVQLDRVPLTSSGKINRSALPAPEINAGESYAAPRNQIEEKLIEIWTKILFARDMPPASIGIDSNFFELGGHSLKATTLVSKIHKELDILVPLEEVFQTPTIRGLSQYMRKSAGHEYISFELVEEKEHYELSFNQKRIWLISQLRWGSAAYNIHYRQELEREMDVKSLEKTLDTLVKKHESLRTRFKVMVGEPRQIIEKTVDISFRVTDISSLEKDEKQAKREQLYKEAAFQPFQLDKPPLFHVLLVRWDNERYDFIFVIHHIISDVWSMEILKKDTTRLYEEYSGGTVVEPGLVGARYRDFAWWQNRYITNRRIKEKALGYWEKKAGGGLPVLELPADIYGREEDMSGAGFRCFIGNELKDRLRKLARENNTTLALVMFAAYNILLSYLSGQKDIVSTLIGAGRDHISLHQTVGVFINLVIVRSHVDYDEDFNYFLGRVNRDVREAVRHQAYPFDLALDELNKKNPVIPVSFNMLNVYEESQEVELPPFESFHIVEAQEVKFELEPYIIEYKNGLDIHWSYKKAKFKPKTMEHISAAYMELLGEISED